MTPDTVPITELKDTVRVAATRMATRYGIAATRAFLASVHRDLRPERRLGASLNDHANEIVLEVSEAHGVSVADIVGPSRNAKLVVARFEAYWRVRRETATSFPKIGRLFGGRDHTTIIHGCGAHARRMAQAAE